MKTYYTVSYIDKGTRNVVWFTDRYKASRFHDQTPESQIYGKYQAFSDEAIAEIEEAISEQDTWRWGK